MHFRFVSFCLECQFYRSFSHITREPSIDVLFGQLPNLKQVWVGKPGSYEEGLGRLAIFIPEVVAKAAAS